MSAYLFDCTKHTIACQHIRGYFDSTAKFQEQQLHLAVKQYTPRAQADTKALPNETSVTIIAAHAVGTVKELYEPLFDELLQATKSKRCAWSIRSIWIADVSTHGESAALNEGLLGVDVCWDDHARDLLHMVNVFRDQMQQPIVGLGHSMGAQNIIQLSLLHPRLFAAIVPIEAIVNRHHAMNFTAAYGLTHRRDVWSSREEAFESTRRAPWIKGWDDRVLQRWQRYGFHDLPTLLYPEAPQDVTAKVRQQGSTPVTLSTTKHHEVHALTRQAYPPRGQPLSKFTPRRPSHLDLTAAEAESMRAPFYRPEAVLTFRQLGMLRPPCFYIWGGKSTFVSAQPKNRADKLAVTGTDPGGSGGREAKMVSEVVFDNEGHFVPFENPKLVAETAVAWLIPMLDRWRNHHIAQSGRVANRDPRSAAVVDDEWRFWVDEWYNPKSVKSRM